MNVVVSNENLYRMDWRTYKGHIVERMDRIRSDRTRSNRKAVFPVFVSFFWWNYLRKLPSNGMKRFATEISIDY